MNPFISFGIFAACLIAAAYGYEETTEPISTPVPSPEAVDGGDMWGGYEGSRPQTRPRYGYGNGNRNNDLNRPTNNFTRQNYVERYGYPEGCAESPNYQLNCNYYVEISKHQNQKYNDALLFELVLHIRKDDPGYVAVGLSKDQMMGEDHIVNCVKMQNKQLTMYHSWSERKSRPNRLREDINVFEMEDRYPFYDPQSETLTCKFWRKYKTNVYVENQPIEFDLIRGKYFVLLAEGPLESRAGTDGVGYHGEKPLEKGTAYVSQNLLGFSTKKFPPFEGMYGKDNDEDHYSGGHKNTNGQNQQRPKYKNDCGHSKPMALVILFFTAFVLL